MSFDARRFESNISALESFGPLGSKGVTFIGQLALQVVGGQGSSFAVQGIFTERILQIVSFAAPVSCLL